MGTVIYLGTDLEKNCEVIIRVLPQDFLGDEEMSARFMQGIDLAKKLYHPNILRVLDAGEEKGIQYVITNYEKGFFLNEYLEHRGELDENESITLVKSLGEALDYAWNEQQIIHRNVCPDTILVAKHNAPMLTDFDLAKSLISGTNLTVAGFAIGNPTYMSPEQAKGEPVDFHSDMYCLGLVFYQLLSGTPPFNSKSRMDTLTSQISEKHAPIQTKNKRITDACSTVLDKMLAKDQKDRYQSWKALIDDLDAILHQKPPSTLQKAAVQPTANHYKMQAVQTPAAQAAIAVKTEEKSASASGRNTIIIALVAVVIIVGVLAGLMNMNKKPNDMNIELKAQTPLKPEIKPADKPEVKPMAQPENKLIIQPEPKSVAQPEVKPVAQPDVKPAVKADPEVLPPVKPNPETNLKDTAVTSAADKAKEEKNRKACTNNIKQIGVALQMYANVFEGKFPEASGAKGLDKLRSGGFLEPPQVYVCPGSGNMPATYGQPITEECCDYVYVGGLSEYSEANTPILWTKPGNHMDFGVILYVNGEIKEFTGNNWPSNTKPKKK